MHFAGFVSAKKMEFSGALVDMTVTESNATHEPHAGKETTETPK